ncbi:MAG TPA: carboxypeptidase-like regulatory domain-containing protein [Acidobacteriaceae bacterium]
MVVLCGLTLFGNPALEAQSTSGGGIQGTITDPSGAAVVNAEVTATNTDTGVHTTRKTNGSGIYSLQPLQTGPYIVEVVATGFQRMLQENITVDNSQVVGLNLKLAVGSKDTTITVTDAPPYLNTTDATLGGTIENELYSQLPLSMNGGPRDPTAFQYLMPGVQENPANNGNVTVNDAAGNPQLTTGATNGNSGVYGGTGQTNLNENYLEGVPVSNINQQGSNNPLATAVSVDAVNQFSTITSGASTSFGGAGASNYTIKSGGNQFHGNVVDYIRNTMFDTWGYLSKVPSSSGIAEKPGEHQNQYDASLSGPIFKDKLFFFGDYSGFHYTKISNTPQYINIPTTAERTGDFTDVMGTATSTIVDATQGSFFGRPAFTGLKNGIPTNNVIPTSELSSISLNLQKALPAPTNLSTFSNYLASLPLSNSDYSVDARLDYTMNSRNKFSVVGIGGVVGYSGAPFYDNYTQLPIPYASGQFTNQKTASGVLSYTYIASQTLINSLKYGFTRTWGQGFSLTQGTKNTASAAGITNLPAGNAADSMPAISFTKDNGPDTPANWASKASTGPVATNSYSVIDNLQWIKGRHNITYGAQVQWLQSNGGSYSGGSNTLALSFHSSSTGYCTQSSVVTATTGCPNNTDGDSYASFLIGAVYQGDTVVQDIVDVGARYRPMAVYVQDNWQVGPKLTLNLGIRYDYLQPYHEVKNRISFLNVSTNNPITGNPGVLEYAGFPNSSTDPRYAPYICHCTTPVHPYNKNFEPRLGFSYAYTPTTVFSGAFALTLTHAGGVGGSIGGASTTGTGNNNEFAQTTRTAANGVQGDPGYFLNPGLPSLPPSVTKVSNPTQGTQNGAAVPGPILAALPPWTPAGVNINPLASTGNYSYVSYFPDHANDYTCSTNATFCTPGGVNFADPYYGGRGPQFISYNFSMQKLINKKAVLTVAYAGSQTHFLPGGSGRGYAINTYSPDFVQQYKSHLIDSCSSYVGCARPYPIFDGSNATVGASLKPFPQFGTMRDLWGSTGNAAYNSLQISVIQRPWHNLSGLVNYTRSKELDDTGNHRTQFPVGPQDGNFTRNYTANQVDRGLGKTNQTNAFNVAFSYTLPIGRGQAFFATNRIMGLIGGGWAISTIYKYRDGYPIQITATSCNPSSNGGQGTCMPDYTPGYDKKSARINGRWGRGPGANAGNLNTISYLNSAAFQCPDSTPLDNASTCGNSNSPGATWKIGNSARSAPYGLTGPGWWDIDLGIRRTFNVLETATLHLQLEVGGDVTNATNSTFFNLNPTNGSQWHSSTFGQISGQNQSIQPRDWQFHGRLRF